MIEREKNDFDLAREVAIKAAEKAGYESNKKHNFKVDQERYYSVFWK